MSDMQNSRRNFIRNSGVALTAALATGAASAAPVDTAAEKLALLEDSNAIRALQQRCFALLERGATQELAQLFSASASQAYPTLQLDSKLEATGIDVSANRMRATARFHGRVQLGAPIIGDGTAQQMARAQGLSSTQWWEQGAYEAQYEKVQGAWLISALKYQKA
jgi:hypothetical protein